MPYLQARKISATAFLLCMTGAVLAQSVPSKSRALELGSSHNNSDAAEAVRRALAKSGGRVLGIERVQFDGRDIMRIKVMDQNKRVRYIDDDLIHHNTARNSTTNRKQASQPSPPQ